jgi:hypothetical protein
MRQLWRISLQVLSRCRSSTSGQLARNRLNGTGVTLKVRDAPDGAPKMTLGLTLTEGITVPTAQSFTALVQRLKTKSIATLCNQCKQNYFVVLI